jgi:hypothetical protein
MTAADPETQFHADTETLQQVVSGLTRLEETLAMAQTAVQARKRGYFTPDEDDHVRQMLLAYRNYRRTLYEIINRFRDDPNSGDPSLQSRRFTVAFAAALVLYAKSLKLIRYYEHEPLVRKKLNEADSKFELEEGFFDRILDAFSSFQNYRLLSGANREWRTRRRIIQKLGLSDAADIKWLGDLIRHQRRLLRRRFWHVLFRRLRYDWRAFWKTTVRPVKDARYRLQSLLGGAFAGIRTTTHYQPAINESILTQLRGILLPGDVLLVRAEQKVTTALLPGFWAHAALFLGTPGDVKALGMEEISHAREFLELRPTDNSRFGHVLEAISPRVLINSLENCLHADHVAVFRPRVSRGQLRESFVEAFGHLGKPYDFEFDFNVTTRIVCTELVYRSYHKRAGIEFQLVKRLGRYTLSCDDIADQILGAPDSPASTEAPPFELIALALRMQDGKCEWTTGASAMDRMRRVQSGWRPASAPLETSSTR